MVGSSGDGVVLEDGRVSARTDWCGERRSLHEIVFSVAGGVEVL
jgi:hypothetical protein